MKKRAAVKKTLIILICFLTYLLLDEFYFYELRKFLLHPLGNLVLAHLIAYFLCGMPIFVGICFIVPSSKVLQQHLGFDGSITTALGFAFICTLPMLIGNAILANFDVTISWRTFWIAVIAAAFFEEFYFRAFLFGQLFRNTKWGFIPAALAGAIFFAAVHLYQGDTFYEALGIFAITFLGAGLYAWVYVEWNYNIWVPIFLHLLMNLSWDLFSTANNALGGVWPNIFRSITIALIIIRTLRLKKSEGKKLNLNKTNILFRTSA